MNATVDKPPGEPANAGAPPEAPPNGDVSEGASEAASATPQAPAPDHVTRADLEVFGRSLVDGLREALTPAPPAPPAAVLPADVPDEQIAAAVEQGNGQLAAQLMRRQAEAISARREAGLREEVAQLRQQGSTSISALARRALESRPHWNTVKATVEAELTRIGKLDPAATANPEVLEYVYKAARGHHADEIEAKVRAEALRSAREPAPAPAPSAAGREANRDAARPLREVVPHDVRRVLDDDAALAADLRVRNAGRLRVGLKAKSMDEHQADIRAEFESKGMH